MTLSDFMSMACTKNRERNARFIVFDGFGAFDVYVRCTRKEGEWLFTANSIYTESEELLKKYKNMEVKHFCAVGVYEIFAVVNREDAE